MWTKVLEKTEVRHVKSCPVKGGKCVTLQCLLKTYRWVHAARSPLLFLECSQSFCSSSSFFCLQKSFQEMHTLDVLLQEQEY